MNPETKTDTFLFSEQAQYGFATCCEEWLCLSVEFIPYLDCASTADEYLRLLVEIVPQTFRGQGRSPRVIGPASRKGAAIPHISGEADPNTK